MEGPWNIILDPLVVRDDFPSLDQSIQKKIKQAIQEKLYTNPLAFSKPLQYSLKRVRSLRVGDYRIAFIPRNKEIVIFAVGHRKVICDIVTKRVGK